MRKHIKRNVDTNLGSLSLLPIRSDFDYSNTEGTPIRSANWTPNGSEPKERSGLSGAAPVQSGPDAPVGPSERVVLLDLAERAVDSFAGDVGRGSSDEPSGDSTGSNGFAH